MSEALVLLLKNLMAPAVLAFAIGFLAVRVKSDLRVPEALSQTLSIYLLLAIGIKGGMALRATELSSLALPLAVTLMVGVARTFSSFGAARALLRARRPDAAALAAHYGSVSALTFIAAKDFAELRYGGDVGVLVGLLAVLEIPALILAVWLSADRRQGGGSVGSVLHEVLFGKSVVLLGGGLLIGLLAPEAALQRTTPFFVDLFHGALVLLLLDLGSNAARQLELEGGLPWRWTALALLLPVVHGALGVLLGRALGFDAAMTVVFAAMCASGSYIAAPAAMRIALPNAQLARCLIASLGITFPFNLTLGIPLFGLLTEFLGN